MGNKLTRVLLAIISLGYIGLILIFLIRDIKVLLNYGYGIPHGKPAFGLPISGFYKSKIIGLIALELGLIITTILINFKINKFNFLAFASFSIPLFFSFLYLELHNKFRNYEFDGTRWLIIMSIAAIFCILLFSKNITSNVIFSVKDYLILLFLMAIVIMFYLIMMRKLNIF